MSETNTLHHHFRLDYLFDIKTAKSIDRNKIIFDDEGEYDFIGRSSDNYGIQGKVRHLGYEPNAANTFSIVQVGESRCLFRDNPWYASQNIFILKPRFPELVDVQLYITCVLNKPLEIYKEAYKYPTLSVLKGIEIQLPVSCNGNPDWSYMQERIAELEQERIMELEQYLVAAGLNDYELNELDKEVLSAPKEKRDFTTGKLFSAEAGDVDIQQKDINGKGCYFINSGLGNNGIKGMTDRPAKVFPKNTITVDFWGNAFYRDFEYKLATHNHVFSLSGEVLKNQEVGLYLASSMTYFRKLFSYNNMGTRNKIMKLLISLPIQTNEEGTPIIDPECKYHAEGYIPDWDYMTSYIRAMKKVVIADVVKYKDEVIAKTCSLVSAK